MSYVRELTIRTLHEKSLHERSCFITLTYDDQHLPADRCVSIDEMQRFFKRARKYGFQFKHVYCGEYGEDNGRPHYHAAILGQDFTIGATRSGTGKRGDPLFDSPVLRRLWPFGLNRVGALTKMSAQYIFQYIFALLKGDGVMPLPYFDAGMRYPVYRTPEFARWSKGLGLAHFAAHAEQYLGLGQVHNGSGLSNIPRYYIRSLIPKGMKVSEFREYELDVLAPEFRDVREKRESVAQMTSEEFRRYLIENTPERLRARAAFNEAKRKANPRDLKGFL